MVSGNEPEAHLPRPQVAKSTDLETTAEPGVRLLIPCPRRLCLREFGMSWRPRSSWFAVGLPLLIGGCFNPEANPADVTDTDGDTDTESGTASATNPTASTAPTTDAPTTTSMTTGGETDPTDTTGDADDDDDNETSATTNDALCGNGAVDDGEACDDGVNDGAYGGCAEDCGSVAAFCGDGELNGPEACDDGTNDGSYGGCATDCAELGPYCGDATVNGDEACDDGTNANGSACSVDCVEPGTLMGSHTLESLSFCDGSFLTRPTFRDNGNALVSASGYCDDDSLILLEVDPAVEVAEDYGDLLLPNTPVRQGELVGDRWVLASQGCNYVIAADGSLTEVCDASRVIGTQGLDAVDDDNYYALAFQGIARFGTGSPAIGDDSTWLIAPPDNATFDYNFQTSSLGPSNSVLVVGSRRLISSGTYSGYIAQYSAGGNLVSDGTTNVTEFIQSVVRGPDGSTYATGGSPDYRLMKFSSNFNVTWDLVLPANDRVELASDSLGNVVAVFRQDAGGSRLVKFDSDGGQVWSNDLTFGTESRIAIDDNDQIWLGSIGFTANGFAFAVRKFAP